MTNFNDVDIRTLSTYKPNIKFGFVEWLSEGINPITNEVFSLPRNFYKYIKNMSPITMYEIYNNIENPTIDDKTMNISFPVNEFDFRDRNGIYDSVVCGTTLVSLLTDYMIWRQESMHKDMHRFFYTPTYDFYMYISMNDAASGEHFKLVREAPTRELVDAVGWDTIVEWYVRYVESADNHLLYGYDITRRDPVWSVMSKTLELDDSYRYRSIYLDRLNEILSFMDNSANSKGYQRAYQCIDRMSYLDTPGSLIIKHAKATQEVARLENKMYEMARIFEEC